MVALTVSPALVMALHLSRQLSLQISILGHGTRLVASAVVATLGVAHLHLHDVGAERRLHDGRMPVMVPAMVMMVVEMLQHRALVMQLLEWAAACTVALTVSPALVMALHFARQLSLQISIPGHGARPVASAIVATLGVAYLHLHDVGAECRLHDGRMPVMVPAVVVMVVEMLQHRALVLQLLEWAAACTVALTVSPALVMALHVARQLSLQISILGHGARPVASAIVATLGVAHLHLHDVGAERRLHDGRMPVMVPAMVVMVVEMLQHRALFLQLLEWAAACTVALTVSPALVMALQFARQLSLQISILGHGTRAVASAVVAALGVAHLHLHDVGAERRLYEGWMPVMVPAMVVMVVEMLQHRALFLQLLEWAAACTVALTVSPALVMALHVARQLSLQISILGHGARPVASAIVATLGVAHLHLHDVGAERRLHDGRMPVMVPAMVVMVVEMLQHRALFLQLLEWAAACTVALTVSPALVMALQFARQLSLQISILGHGTRAVASAVVAALGVAHLHLHDVGAERRLHDGRMPVMVPAMVVMVVEMLQHRALFLQLLEWAAACTVALTVSPALVMALHVARQLSLQISILGHGARPVASAIVATLGVARLHLHDVGAERLHRSIRSLPSIPGTACTDPAHSSQASSGCQGCDHLTPVHPLHRLLREPLNEMLLSAWAKTLGVGPCGFRVEGRLFRAREIKPEPSNLQPLNP